MACFKRTRLATWRTTYYRFCSIWLDLAKHGLLAIPGIDTMLCWNGMDVVTRALVILVLHRQFLPSCLWKARESPSGVGVLLAA